MGFDMTHDILVFCAGFMLASFIDEVVEHRRPSALLWCLSFFAFDAWKAWG